MRMPTTHQQDYYRQHERERARAPEHTQLTQQHRQAPLQPASDSGTRTGSRAGSAAQAVGAAAAAAVANMSPHAAPHGQRDSPVASTTEERVGQDYVLGKEIGKGSFAVVRKGYKVKPRTAVAIKVVTRSKLTPKLLENLEGEIAILRAISHANIVELSDCLKTESHIYLIMAFAAWGDLSMYIRSGGRLPGFDEQDDNAIWSSRDLSASVVRQQQTTQRLAGMALASSGYGLRAGGAGAGPSDPLAALRDEVRQFPHPPDGGLHELVVRSFLHQLSAAIEFMRAKDVVHRDIKPQNLLLQPAEHAGMLAEGHPRGIPQVKVADFGFARHLPSSSLADTLCGSPLYMAPEILRYESYSAKADLWSVGAVAYEMCVGKPPFRAANHVDLLARIERAEDRIRFPDERSEGSLAREDARRKDEGLPPLLRPHALPEDVKALIRRLLRRKAVERASFEDLFASDVVRSGSPRALAEAVAARRAPKRQPSRSISGSAISASGSATSAAAATQQQPAQAHTATPIQQGRSPLRIEETAQPQPASQQAGPEPQSQTPAPPPAQAPTPQPSSYASSSPARVPPGAFERIQPASQQQTAAARQRAGSSSSPRATAATAAGQETQPEEQQPASRPPARPTWGFTPKYVVPAAGGPQTTSGAALAGPAAQQPGRQSLSPRSGLSALPLSSQQPQAATAGAHTASPSSAGPAAGAAHSPSPVAANIPLGAFDRRASSSPGAGAGAGSLPRQSMLQHLMAGGASASPPAHSPTSVQYPRARNASTSSSAGGRPYVGARRTSSIEGGGSGSGSGSVGLAAGSRAASIAKAAAAAAAADGEEPSSMEDNAVATPGSANTHMLVGVAGYDAPLGPRRSSSGAGPSALRPDTSGSGNNSASGSLLGGEYAIVEKRNVEVNALADELGMAAKFPVPLHRRPSRLSKLGGAAATAAVAGLSAAGGSLGRSSALALGLAPITAREQSDFSASHQRTEREREETGPSTPGSDASPSTRARPWPIPSAPFAIPPDQRPASFHRRASLSSSGSPSPRLLNQSLPQSTAPSPASHALRSPISGPVARDEAVGAVSSSPRDVALNRGASSLSASPTPSPYRAPPGTWTSYTGPSVGSAPSSALSRAISMASVRLFGVPSGMTLRHAASLVRSRSFRRIGSASPHGAGEGTPDAAESLLLNQLEDLGQKSFVLSEFADSRLAQHFPSGPHQQDNPETDPAAALVGSLGRADSTRLRRSPQPDRRTSSSSVHSATGSVSDATHAAEVAAAEALVLYAKSMSFLQRGIDMTREFLDARSQNGWRHSPSLEVNETVQWLRARFNASYEKADFARARCGEVPPPAQSIDKLIFDKALEIARAAAVDELENNREGVAWDSARCLLAYETASSMLLALLDPGEEGLTLSQTSIVNIEKFSRSVSKRIKALQDRVEPVPSV